MILRPQSIENSSILEMIINRLLRIIIIVQSISHLVLNDPSFNVRLGCREPYIWKGCGVRSHYNLRLWLCIKC